MIKIKDLNYWDVKNLHRLEVSQKLPVDCFKWVGNTSQFNRDFIENYNKDEGYFLKVDIQYLEELHHLHNDLPFLPERIKIEKVKKLVTNLHNKKIICHTQKEFKASIK